MKLLGVSVEGCGRFATQVRIEGLGPGVNILSDRNEAGKSTLFRAIRTCLFERHSSSHRDIAALATEGLSLPVAIRVAFEHKGKHYEIAKSFLRSKSASLTCDGAVIARNAEADERVWELLGIQRAAKSLDEATYGLLWVQQGQSFAAPEPTEAAASMLNQVIQQEVGTLVGGERARQLLAGVREELGRYLTDTGRPKSAGPLQEAIEENARLTAERIDAETQLAALDHRLEQLAQLRSDLKSAADPGVAQSMAADLLAARQALTEAEKAGEELKRLAADERHASERLETQRERLDALRRRAEAIGVHRIRLKELAQRLAGLDEEFATAQHALQEAQDGKAAGDAEAEALEQRERALAAQAELAQRLAARQAMEQRLARLEDFSLRSARNEAALKAKRVDEQALAQLTALDTEEARLRAGLEAGAARVAIAAAPGSNVTLNGGAVGSSATRSVTEPLVIAVGTGVTITVSPPEATREAAEKALAAHRSKLRALLDSCGAASADELRRLRAERREAEDEARELRAERSALMLADGLAVEVARLRSAIAELDAEAARLVPDGTALPGPEEIAAVRHGNALRRDELRAVRSDAEAGIARLREALAKLSESRAALRGQTEEIHARLSSDLASLPDESRERLLAAAEEDFAARREAHRVKLALLGERQALAPAEGEADRLRSRVERLETALRSQQDKAAGLRETIARIEGEVQAAGGDGLGERAQTLKLQQEMALAAQGRLEARVEALKLLRKTVEACYEERREQLNEPLRRHLRPFLHDVFPQAEIELGENFAIAGLSRTGPAAELFGRLSLGTQEQVAVLVRLAMGAMVCERGTDVPIMLDDALVFSDDARIEQMFDAISRAGRNQQVIVFTCRARSFTSLGGRQLRIV